MVLYSFVCFQGCIPLLLAIYSIKILKCLLYASQHKLDHMLA